MIPLPDDLALFQYYKGITFGVALGFAVAWLWWRLPIHLRTRRTRQLRAIVLDMKRIQSAYRGQHRENTRVLRVARIPIRDRVQEAWVNWKADWQETTRPRSPEEVALETQRALAGAR